MRIVPPPATEFTHPPISLVRVEKDIERWLLQSGLTELSVASLRPALPRWTEFLRSHGVTSIPEIPSRVPNDGYATNLLCLLVKQTKPVRVGPDEHELRNLIGIRPFKP